MNHLLNFKNGSWLGKNGQNEHLISELSEHSNTDFRNIPIYWLDERCDTKDNFIEVFNDFRKQVYNGSGLCNIHVLVIYPFLKGELISKYPTL